MQTSAPPPKPPKIPKDARSDVLHTAPQLPPLYFESQPAVSQQDFAYSKPPAKTSIPQIGAPPPSKDQDHDIPRSDSVTILPVPFPPARPSDTGPTGHRARRTSQSLQPSQQQSSRKSPSIPVNNLVAQPHPEAPTGQANRSTAVRKGSGESKPRRQSQTIQIPQQQKDVPENDTEDPNNSFYFHSPQSSTDEALDESPKASASKGTALPSAKTVTSDYGLSSASALGFGGPSDWEHFGDYDAEEIDDEDLYVSSKPKPAELPSVTSPIEEPSSQPIALSVTPEMSSSTVPPPVESPKKDEVVNEPQPDPAAAARIEKSQVSRNTVVAEDQAITRTPPPPSLPLLFESSPDKPLLESCDEQTAPKDDVRDEKPSSPGESDKQSQAPVQKAESHEGGSFPSNIGGSAENLPSTAAQDANKDNAFAEEAPPATVINGRVNQDEGGDLGATMDSSPSPTGRGQEKTETEVVNIQKDADHQIEGLTTLDSKPICESDHDVSGGNDSEVGEDIIISLEMPDSRQGSISEPVTHGDTSLDRVTTNHLSPMPRGPLETGRSDRRSVFPNSVELEDPYANLDAWAKASLNRYVKMLREESSAEEEEQKYMIFTNFTRRETRLRAVLYDMDDDAEPVVQPPAIKRTLLKGSTSILTLRPSIKSKALPALPPGAQPPMPSPAKEQPKKLETPLRPVEKLQEIVEPDVKSDRPKLTQLDVQGSTMRGSSEESYVMVESPSDQQYTPGGRPVIPPIQHDKSSSPLKVASSLTSLRQALDVVGIRTGGKSSNRSRSPVPNPPSGSTPTTSDVKNPEPPRSNSVPLPPISGSDTDKITAAAEKPAYKPMKFNEGRPYEGDKASNRQSIYMPFAGLLRESSQRHGSLYNGVDSHKRISARASIASNQTHPDSLEAGKRQSELAKTNNPNQRYSILEPLLVVVPSSSVLRPEPAQIVRLRKQIESLPDDFAFIHELVLAWHSETKQKQELLDRERHARQGESEQRIDALFNDNEIGYGDISELEAEFKRSEAAKKADEDRVEYQSFVKNVFEVVWTRLHYEMDQLTPLYDTCTQVLNDATAGKEMFDDSGERVPVAPAMDTLLALYQKLGVRHQKAFEAVLERDRRLKKTEVAPWYALGEIGKVKKIERRFEEAEKKAILDFCRQRDERANLLMDVLDQNTMRGVGSNQDYMEAVMQAVRKIAIDVALGAGDDGTPIPPDEVLKAKTITAALAKSSEQIVQTFHVADMLLNAADYEVSVANARLANADADAFKRLREAKAKEDAKLVKDLEHRMTLIRGDTGRTTEEVGKLLSLISREEGEKEKREREVRLGKALEEAKRRNLGKEGV